MLGDYENETKAVTTNCDQNHQIIDRSFSSLTSQFTHIYEKFFQCSFFAQDGVHNVLKC